jgi:hypothetical protein
MIAVLAEIFLLLAFAAVTWLNWRHIIVELLEFRIV